MFRRIIAEPYLTNPRNLRKHQTPWESKLWHYLRANRFYGLNFKRQVQIGACIFDFSCRSKMLLIELDGSQHSDKKIIDLDSAKQIFAINQGYKILRFWNNDLDNNTQGVLETIKILAEFKFNLSLALASRGEGSSAENSYDYPTS